MAGWCLDNFEWWQVSDMTIRQSLGISSAGVYHSESSGGRLR